MWVFRLRRRKLEDRGRPRAPEQDPSSSSREERRRRSGGLTLLEVLITLGITGLLAAIAAEAYDGALHRARVTRAIADIRVMEKLLGTMEVEDGLPASLEGIGWSERRDPWGNPYQYLSFEGLEGLPGKARKDRFLVPLNSSYDLYSMGPDGASQGPLTAKVSRDDILRAADGAFVGKATDF
jgi:general secretion pathway protein G